MIRLKNIIKGEKSDIILMLYKSLNLHNYSSSLIEDVRPYKKCVGFYHFQIMHYTKGKNQIMPYTKSEDLLVRSNAITAYLALIDLEQENIPNIPKKTTFLNLIKIMDLLNVKKIEYSQNLDFLLQSDAPSYLILGLRIAAYFNNRNDATKIIQLVSYPVDLVKEEALTTISKLFLLEAETPVLDHLNTLPKEVQIKCYCSLAVIGSKKTSDFIHTHFANLQDPEIQLAAMYCLQKIDLNLANQLAGTNKDYSIMLKHVKALWKY